MCYHLITLESGDVYSCEIFNDLSDFKIKLYKVAQIIKSDDFCLTYHCCYNGAIQIGEDSEIDKARTFILTGDTTTMKELYEEVISETIKEKASQYYQII